MRSIPSAKMGVLLSGGMDLSDGGSEPLLWLLVACALLFAFINGWRDSSSILAGVITSRALSPRLALALAGTSALAAPFLFGVAVAKTLTTGLVDARAVSIEAIVTAMVSALAWSLFAWWRGIPSSSSHALVGGILGAAIANSGPQVILADGLFKVLVPLFLAPLIGLGAGWLGMKFILAATWNAHPRINTLFQRLQVITMVALALAHSANDTQKSMGIITLGLLLSGQISTFEVPLWVIATSAAALALGAARGDWRLMHTLGTRIFRIRPVNALASQSASGVIIFLSSLAGAPVSTSQVISMALIGSGAAERVNKVRWQVGVDMLLTWILTIPVTMMLAAGMFWLVLRLETMLGVLN